MDRMQSPAWSVSPPNTPHHTVNVGLASTSQHIESVDTMVPIQRPAPPFFLWNQAQSIVPAAGLVPMRNSDLQSQLIHKHEGTHFPKTDLEPDFPEPLQILTESANKTHTASSATTQAIVDQDAVSNQGHRPWTNDDIGIVIGGVTDPDHPENFKLAQAKGFNAHIEAQWSQLRFPRKYLDGRWSARAVWTKFKEIKETYREVRTLHKETGNGGLLQIEDSDSKPEIMKKLDTRLQKFESRVGQLKHVTSKEVYYT
ncbi:unnamed protein product [Rhizoctonia solani]|uniref:Uncharacterized protein n=1 Tax=Rhizoctonia solani TaxID=456999 RepID=A0A8H3A0E9_9AGAM|nr:unnamed protein product [Rhizoctonia solani]CAE6465855.1 unnamed protein product [Rhizoctonia solani]